MSYNWKQWQGKIVDGKFPLHQYLGASDHDAVFLTDRVQHPTRVAIKLIPTEFVDADRQLDSWQKASTLAHRHLLRIFEHGRSLIDGVEVLYVVMEYAEEDLSQILPERPLTATECTDMLQPVVDALAYIHGQGLINGHVMPSNIMASGNEVKISSDEVQVPGPPLVKPSQDVASYYAPEVAASGLSVSSDVWSLGVTALEAVTQKVLSRDPSESGDPAIPQLPEPLSSIIRNCLRIDPQQRWTLAQISTALRPETAASKPAPSVTAPSPTKAVATPPIAARVPTSAPVPSSLKPRRSWLPLFAIGVVLLALIGYFATRKSTSEDQQQTASQVSKPADTSTDASTVPASTSAQPAVGSSGKGEVLHREAPEVTSAARNSIHGTVRVKVRVSVDPSGNVTATALENHGPSRYFANAARRSAADWKFAPPEVDGKPAPSEWVLKYEFRRGGTSVTPVQETP